MTRRGDVRDFSQSAWCTQKREKNILATDLAFARCGFIEEVSSFLRNCGAASVGEWNMEIWFYQTSWSKSNYYCERFGKLTFRALALSNSFGRRANARNVSNRTIIDSFDKVIDVSLMSVQPLSLQCYEMAPALTSSFVKFGVFFILCDGRFSCDGFSSVYCDDGID